MYNRTKSKLSTIWFTAFLTLCSTSLFAQKSGTFILKSNEIKTQTIYELFIWGKCSDDTLKVMLPNKFHKKTKYFKIFNPYDAFYKVENRTGNLNDTSLYSLLTGDTISLAFTLNKKDPSYSMLLTIGITEFDKSKKEIYSTLYRLIYYDYFIDQVKVYSGELKEIEIDRSKFCINGKVGYIGFNEYTPVVDLYMYSGNSIWCEVEIEPIEGFLSSYYYDFSKLMPGRYKMKFFNYRDGSVLINLL